jgi:hypothetical protein
MDVSAWQQCADPKAMLQFLDGRVGERKFWLFACACCRYATQLLPGDAYQGAVDIAERFADQLASSITQHMVWQVLARWKQELLDAHDERLAALREFLILLERVSQFEQVSLRAFQVAWLFSDLATLPSLLSWSAPSGKPLSALLLAGEARYRQFQCAVLRDLCGTPGAPPDIAPAWLAWNEGTVVRIAQGIHETGDFVRMGVLADALEDAGCADPVLLGHCRAGTPHVRGCHVLDALLGKA